MKRFAIALAYAAAGYLVGALVGYFLVLGLSGNAHDRALEAAMMAAFVSGPIAALGFALYGAARGRRSISKGSPDP
jgi:hypothetical protein